MAGFLDRFTSNRVLSTIQNRIKEISNLGIRYDDAVVRNSHATGYTETQFLRQGTIADEATMYSLAMADTTVKKYIAHFDKDYANRRDFLRKFSMNGEIQWALDNIADECIVQDEQNFFCYTSTINMDIKEEIIKAYEDTFQRIYSYWRFSDDITAWQYMYQLLVDGFLAFEIIYSDNGKKIIGFKELDPISLSPAVEKQADGTFKNIWWQNEQDLRLRRKLYDAQVIYIAYAKGNSISRVSYVERLVRSFNLLRIMEHTRVIWNVMNASFRLKVVVPVGSKSPQKAKESLGELISIYKEDVRLDNDSGELFINGRPNIQFFKNYMIPSNDRGEQTDISVMGGEGPDLSNIEVLSYFTNKLKMDSKIPFARWDAATSGGLFQSSIESVDREEIRFGRFINRLRSVFQEIIVKPIYLQMVLDFPELEDDEIFRSQIGVRFNKNNVFEQLKEMDLLKKKAEFVNTMKDIKTMKKGQEVPFFHPEFLIQQFINLPANQLETNKRFWDLEEEGQSGFGGGGGETPAGGGGGEAGGEGEGGGGEEEGPFKL
jgi:hypothetical protein